jgi:hypothetical protein
MYRIIALLLTVVTLVAAPTGSLLAQEVPTWVQDLPPGIAAQALPILEEMRAHMMEMEMAPGEMQMMMADMQRLAEQLPPGIFLQILELMHELDMQAMMMFHQQIRQGNLLELPPGQILLYVKQLS